MDLALTLYICSIMFVEFVRFIVKIFFAHTHIWAAKMGQGVGEEPLSLLRWGQGRGRGRGSTPRLLTC